MDIFMDNKLKGYFFSISTPEINKYIKEELWICIMEHIKKKDEYFEPSKPSRENYYRTIVRNYTMVRRNHIKDYLDGRGTASNIQWCDRLFKRANRNKILSDILQ